MSVVQRSLVGELVRANIITPDYNMTNGYKKKLLCWPGLCQRVVEYTSFLKYNAPLNIRIQCIIRGFVEQPVCDVCGTDVKMRENGRFRYTFPHNCGKVCSAKNPQTISKKKATNVGKYGVENPLFT